MVEGDSSQAKSAQVAAKAREAIAKKIADLVPGVEDDAAAQVTLHLAEAYAYLAAEPPKVRAAS
jgi:hypothetical protein